MTAIEQAINEYYAHFGAPYPYAVGIGFKGETDEEIVYTILKEEGPDHDKSFWAQVSVGKKALGTGKGRTKKAAEQAAAYDAILARKKA